MERKIWIIFVLFITLLCGCLDDHTNLDYKNVILPDSVIVTDVAKQRKVYLGENAVSFIVTSGNELQLDVEVKYRGDDELTYEWRLGEKVISKEQNLRYVCTEEGEQQALLLVYRKNAGNATVYPFVVHIREPFDAGILVLGKHGGKTKLDFIERFVENRTIEMGGQHYEASVHEYIEHPDIYPLYNNGEELSSTPVQLLYCAGIMYAANRYSGVQILDRDWKNSVLVNLKTMKKIVSMGDEFVGDPGDIKLKSMCDVGATSLLLDESGKIFSRVNYDDSNPGTGRFVSEPLGYNDPTDVPDKGTEELKANYITAGASALNDLAFIYEKDKKRILAMTAAEKAAGEQSIDYSMIHKLAPAFSTPGCVDLNNFDKELIEIFLPPSMISASMGNIYIFYKDESDYYLQVAMVNSSILSIPHSVSCMNVVPDIKLPNELGSLLEQGNGVFKIANKDNMNETLYIGVGNTIYSMVFSVFDYSLNSFTLFHKFEEAGNITDMVFTETWEETSGAVNRYARGRVFAASFDNGDLRVVKLYDDPSKPGEVQKKYWVQKNYDGGIVDMIYYNNSK